MNNDNFICIFFITASENVPVLRNATLALDEAAQALNRMRSENNPRDRK